MRLTIAKRDIILKEETSKKFHTKELNLKSSIIKEIDERVAKSIPEIPQNLIDEGYIYTDNTVIINPSESISLEEIRENLGIVSISTYNIRKVKLNNYYPCSRRNINTITITKSILNKCKKLRKLKEEKEKFKKDLRRILNSYNTTKQLCKAVPELSIHFKDEIRQSALVPHGKIEEIRKQLVRK